MFNGRIVSGCRRRDCYQATIGKRLTPPVAKPRYGNEYWLGTDIGPNARRLEVGAFHRDIA